MWWNHEGVCSSKKINPSLTYSWEKGKKQAVNTQINQIVHSSSFIESPIDSVKARSLSICEVASVSYTFASALAFARIISDFAFAIPRISLKFSKWASPIFVITPTWGFINLVNFYNPINIYLAPLSSIFIFIYNNFLYFIIFYNNDSKFVNKDNFYKAIPNSLTPFS